MRQIHQFKRFSGFGRGPRNRCGGDRVAKGEKKPPGSPAVFSGISVALYAPSTLSIRQRSEMPKKVKVKLGGHDGDSVRQKS
ncbi:TPA: hypothetical protein ACK3Q6_004783 [Burkholderia cepacia]|uniref:hypothetical protein n=1 Tax=Burkholderia cepacia TaxID=292 RepID=UPI001CF24ACA|nr:hypothetical protein [Burkholderia cepacia]MCA8362029.1 hypothetical protein [Burkholderia cepacia]HDR9762345.1 hypothetical protein [Burkholderia cepacia ATCC 25416]HDV6367383.1 hypothetical protein [Burkholderia cepacia]